MLTQELVVMVDSPSLAGAEFGGVPEDQKGLRPLWACPSPYLGLYKLQNCTQ